MEEEWIIVHFLMDVSFVTNKKAGKAVMPISFCSVDRVTRLHEFSIDFLSL